VDIMVNTAGINVPDRALRVLTHENWERMLKINLSGAFNCTQAVLPAMREQKSGTIIHVSSISARFGDMSGAGYQATKAGIMGLCYATMFEERLNGIRVTAIMPGLANTPWMKQRATPPPKEILEKALNPEDIASGILFCASLPPHAFVPELIILPGGLQCIGQTVT
jgi:serine 3-dehydrogenase (NADP+)